MNELVQPGFVKEGSDGFESMRLIWEQMTLWPTILFIVGLVWDVVSGLLSYVKPNKSDTSKIEYDLGLS